MCSFYYWGNCLAHYNKGANAERELAAILYANGFAVIRAAGSGVTKMPCPDVIALSVKKKLAFECKAWKSNYLNISIEQFRDLLEWKKKSSSELYFAWKVPNKGWFFLTPLLFKQNPKGFAVSRKKALLKALDLNVVIGKQAILDFPKEAKTIEGNAK